METYRLAVIGFGNVGQGFAQILVDQGEQIERENGLKLLVVAVCDAQKGSLYDPNGLDLAVLLRTAQSGVKLDRIAAPFHGWDALRTISETNADVVVELSFTNLETGEPATTHLRKAFEAGKSAVTTNKGPIALHYPELKALAVQHAVQLGVEGTVMSGTPCLRLASEMLAPAGITRIQGILNGTTNYILTQMETGASYADALADAQQRGYAEADPRGDVEGIDAAGKVVILANLLMGARIEMASVDRKGITGLTLQDIHAAQAAGERWKLIGKIEKVGDKVTASVQPTRLPVSHPLAGVSGATNAITFSTGLLGDVTLIGPGAGRMETGYAVLLDLLAMRGRWK
jgi:homoserine dehydrogenase